MTTINLAQINSSTIRPGFLVSLKTSLSGGVTYQTKGLEQNTEEKTEKAKWETTRIIADVDEHEAGVKARGKCRSLIASTCINTSFGLLCPENQMEDFESAVAAARQLASDFNATAKVSRVSVAVLVGRIAQDDVDAMKALNGEVRELLETMEAGLANLDVKTVRDAAQRAKNLGAMLSVEAQAKVTVAVEAARKAARKMVGEAGETVSTEIDRVTIRKIAEQRTAFLDLEDARDVRAPAADARSVDLAPVKPVATSPAAAGPALEL